MQNIETTLKGILTEILHCPARIEQLSSQDNLTENLPELDSMAIVGIISAIEEHYQFSIADDEISFETFTSIQTLTQFIQQKLATAELNSVDSA